MPRYRFNVSVNAGGTVDLELEDDEEAFRIAERGEEDLGDLLLEQGGYLDVEVDAIDRYDEEASAWVWVTED